MSATGTSVAERRVKVATIFRTLEYDKVQLDVMQGDIQHADRLGGGSLLLNLQHGHGLNPGDVLILTVVAR